MHLDRCTRLDPEQFRRLFDIELNPLVDNDSGEAVSEHTTTTVWLKCVPGGIQLYLEDDATGRTVVRVVDMAHVAEGARVRLLVLLVTELVVASWLELRPSRPRSADPGGTPTTRETEPSRAQPAATQPAATQPAATQPAATQPAATQPAATHEVPLPFAVGELGGPAQLNRAQPSQPRLAMEEKNTAEALDEPTDVGAPDTDGVDRASIRHRHWRLGLTFEARRFSSIASPLLGGEMAGAYRPWRAFELGLGARLSRASFTGSLPGERTLHIALTMISASLTALFVHAANDFELNAGAGVRSGVALLELVASNAATPRRSGAQPWLAPIVVFGGAYRIVADVHLRAGIELGATAGVNIAVVENPGTPRERQQSVAAVRGWFGALALGLDWIF